ncbi:hypothetical protein AGMMS50268_33760 [Spirochaetia bacterium]|nr:hypothetical protein AGMMS50268_33760 [Spirochaetia bacterium]
MINNKFIEAATKVAKIQNAHNGVEDSVSVEAISADFLKKVEEVDFNNQYNLPTLEAIAQVSVACNINTKQVDDLISGITRRRFIDKTLREENDYQRFLLDKAIKLFVETEDTDIKFDIRQAIKSRVSTKTWFKPMKEEVIPAGFEEAVSKSVEFINYAQVASSKRPPDYVATYSKELEELEELIERLKRSAGAPKIAEVVEEYWRDEKSVADIQEEIKKTETVSKSIAKSGSKDEYQKLQNIKADLDNELTTIKEAIARYKLKLKKLQALEAISVPEYSLKLNTLLKDFIDNSVSELITSISNQVEVKL